MNMQALNNLIEVITEGDERVKPKLTEKEVSAIQWAKQRIEELEEVNKRLGSNWIKTLIFNIELLDENIPGWRESAKKELEQVQTLFTASLKK
jgi:hypothetical protein